MTPNDENHSRDGRSPNAAVRDVATRAADETRLAAQRAQARRAGAATSQLLRLREMSRFTLGERRFDVRGWQVYSHDAELVGLVDSLFVDMHARTVRYVGIALSDTRTGGTAGTVLVPVGAAARPRDRRVLVLSAISAAQLAGAPRVGNRPITRADEDAALATFAMATSRDVGVASLYDGPNFDETRLFG
jgi:hypothetical protein